MCIRDRPCTAIRPKGVSHSAGVNAGKGGPEELQLRPHCVNMPLADCQTSAVGLLPRRGLYTQQFDYGGDRCVAALRTRGRSRLSFIALFWNGLTSLFPLPHSSLRRLPWFSAVAGPQAAHGFSVISSCVGLLSIGAMTYPDTLYRSSPFFCRNTAK